MKSFTTVFASFLGCFTTVAVAETAKSYAYVPGSGTNDVSVIDTSTQSVVATIGVGNYPLGVATFLSRDRVYVTNSNSDSVSVIDTVSNAVSDEIKIPTIAPAPLSIPQDIAITADGTRLYVALVGTNEVAEINTATNAITRRIKVGSAPSGVAVNRRSHTLYVSNQNSDNVFVIDLPTGDLRATIPVNHNPLFVALSPDGRLAVVSSAASHSLTVINAQSNAVERVLPVTGQAMQMVFSPHGDRLYAVDNAGSAASVVEVFDTSTFDRLTPIPTESSPYGIDLTPDGKLLFVPCAATNHLMIFDTSDWHLVRVVLVGLRPFVYGHFIGAASPPAAVATIPLNGSFALFLAATLLLSTAAFLRSSHRGPRQDVLSDTPFNLLGPRFIGNSCRCWQTHTRLSRRFQIGLPETRQCRLARDRTN